MCAGACQWSDDNRGLATRNDNMPTTVWLWDMMRRELAATLMQKDPMKTLDWDVAHCRLAMCTGTSNIFMWAQDGPSCVHVPLQGFMASAVRWNPTGTAFVITDRDTVRCAFLGAP